jgi:hypothetical protein
VFGQYDDAEIYEALRRVHLIPLEDGSATKTVEVDEDGDEVRSFFAVLVFPFDYPSVRESTS